MARISKNYTFSPNTSIKSSEVNTNFDTIYNEFNGNISEANLADDAITTDKIADGAITPAKLGLGLSSVIGWDSLGSAPNSVSHNGNRSYNIVFNNQDLTSTTSPGMRLKLPRTVTAPTQCADLESGSSQYFSRASASVGAMTFTDDFVVSAWVKLESYGADRGIIGRYNGTSGWFFSLNTNGQVRLSGRKGGAGNVSEVVSYQSIPLGKWVHVAAQLDMSAFTATSTTSYVMIDGVDVPASVSRSGTNPTDLTQAGDLEIGGFNSGTNLFDGKIAQVALYSAKVTQATIRASMNQTLTGSETSLLVGYTFNGVLTDVSSNGYTLTANGGATATDTDTPFTNPVTGTSVTAGTTNYGIIMSQSFSTNTTYVVQVPEGETLPTTGGIGTVSYSTQKTPYGFPGARSKWEIISHFKVAVATASNASYGSFANGGWAITVPVGAWNIGYDMPFSSTANNISAYFNISPISISGVSAGNENTNYTTYFPGSDNTFIGRNNVTVRNKEVLSSQQTYTAYTQGATTANSVSAANSLAQIIAENDYL